MPEFLGAILLLVLGGTAAMVLRAHLRPAQCAGQAGAIAGCAIGLAGAVRILASGQPENLWAPSFMPGGAVHLQIDALSAFFLLPVFGLSIVTAVYGGSYMQDRGEPRRAAASWFFLNLLTAGMAMVVAAHDGLLFLVAWEIMALSPFFLVIFDDQRAAVRHAAWTYLTATHIGTAFLLVLFVLLGGAGRRLGLRVLQRRSQRQSGALLRRFRARPDRVRLEGGDRSGAYLAAGSTSGRTESCLGADVRRDDQGRHLRPSPHPDAGSADRSRGGAGS